LLQIGFANITVQAGGDPTSTYPNGSFPVSFFTIIGDFTYIEEVMDKAPIGIAMLGVYALIAQVMLVNLLIAMMGSTYNKVSENSTEEWKFYRLEMVMENQTASFQPPPTNLIIIPVAYLIKKIKYFRKTWCQPHPNSAKQTLLPRNPSVDENRRNSTGMHIHHENPPLAGNESLKKMQIARDTVVNKEIEEQETAVIAVVKGLQERLRTLINERENDRTFSEKKFKELAEQNKQILKLLEKSQFGGNQQSNVEISHTTK